MRGASAGTYSAAGAGAYRGAESGAAVVTNKPLPLTGIGVGAGLVYFALRVGKLAFGRQQLALAGETKIIFTDTALLLPDK